jgi:hypothetical protein
MRKFHNLPSAGKTLLFSSALILVLSSASIGTSAGNLNGAVAGAVGGVAGAVGSVGHAAGETVGGVTGAVSASAKTSGGLIGDTKATVDALNPKGVLQAKARSVLLGGIKAKALVLSKKNLVKLCLGVGGGSGCGDGFSRNRLLGLIDYRLTLLSKKKLLGVCVSVGATGCGSSIASNPPEEPNPPNNPPNTNPPDRNGLISSLSDSDQQKLRTNCRKVLDSPSSYNRDMIAVCRLLKI